MYEAPEGQPFLELATAAVRWSAVARWMIDLADEGDQALEDPSPLTVGSDRVWIVPDGRALLVDFPVPGVEPRAASLLNDVDSLQTFLGEVVSTGLLGSVHLRSFLFPFDIDTGGAKTPRGPAYRLGGNQQRRLRRTLGETGFGIRSHRRRLLERLARAEFLTGSGLVHALRPAPQGFRGHLIAREYSQETCRNGETRSGIGGGGGSPEGDRRRRRVSARRKRETVLRLLRGEDLESVSRELGITAARASQWRDQFLAAGQASLKSRAPDARDADNRRLQAKIGELLMENELLYAKVDQLEAGGPLARRRSRR